MDERGVIAIPSDVPVELAAILGCAVVTGLGAVFHVAHVKPGDTVAVIGCGGVGLNVIQGARIAGAARIVAIDANPQKLPLAGRLGATDLVDASDVDPVEAVRGLTGGRCRPRLRGRRAAGHGRDGVGHDRRPAAPRTSSA